MQLSINNILENHNHLLLEEYANVNLGKYIDERYQLFDEDSQQIIDTYLSMQNINSNK